MIALPAPRLASGSRTAAAVPYPLHRLAAMGSSERFGGRGGATALGSANVGAPGPSALRRRMQEPGPKRYAALLATVVASFLILGIAQPAAWGQLAVTCLLGATLMLALWVCGARPLVFRAAILIVAATIAIGIAEAAAGSVDGRAAHIANGLVAALAPPAVMIGVVRTLRTERRVGIEAVFGVISIYVLLGMLYAFVYGTIDRFGGAPFFAQGGGAGTSRCLYFSFATLSTVGYGDLTARSNLGHTLAISEALLGQIYLVTIVSLLVANLGRSAKPAAEGQETR
jgi:Ion channel